MGKVGGLDCAGDGFREKNSMEFAAGIHHPPGVSELVFGKCVGDGDGDHAGALCGSDSKNGIFNDHALGWVHSQAGSCQVEDIGLGFPHGDILRTGAYGMRKMMAQLAEIQHGINDIVAGAGGQAQFELIGQQADELGDPGKDRIDLTSCFQVAHLFPVEEFLKGLGLGKSLEEIDPDCLIRCSVEFGELDSVVLRVAEFGEELVKCLFVQGLTVDDGPVEVENDCLYGGWEMHAGLNIGTRYEKRSSMRLLRFLFRCQIPA